MTYVYRSGIKFKKSSKSNNSGNGGGCVGLAWLPTGELAVCDTKEPDGNPFLTISASSAARFLATAARDGFRREPPK
jgi:hypothetical protein